MRTMKALFLTLCISVLIFNVVAQQTGTFIDPRDGKTYSTVKIDNMTWMAGNLAFKPPSGNYWAFDYDESNVKKYGYLYDWPTALTVCPTGWRLPGDAEWAQLINFVGSNPGDKLKAKDGWENNGNGTDDFGFKALPGGYRYGDGTFHDIGKNGTWWSSAEYSPYAAWSYCLSYPYGNASRNFFGNQWGFSVRCIQDF